MPWDRSTSKLPCGGEVVEAENHSPVSASSTTEAHRVAGWRSWQKSMIIGTLEPELLRVSKILWVGSSERLPCLPLFIISKEVWQSNNFYSPPPVFILFWMTFHCGVVWVSFQELIPRTPLSITNNNNKETKEPHEAGDQWRCQSHSWACWNKEALWECKSFIRTN